MPGVIMYAGDSDGKRLARADMYLYAKEALDRSGLYGRGQALILAGPTAAEGVWLTSLGFAGEQQVYVDTDACGLTAAKAYAPNCEVYNCDVRCVLREGSWAWVHLDFCGNWSNMVEECLSLLRYTLLPGAMVAVTVLKGREGDHSNGWRNAKARARPILKRESHLNERIVGIQLRGSDLLGGADRNWLSGVWQYCSDVSPMLTMMWRRVLRPDERFGNWPIQSYYTGREDLSSRVKRVTLYLRDKFERRQPGMGTKVAARLMDLPNSTVAAWAAHATMGAYRG